MEALPILAALGLLGLLGGALLWHWKSETRRQAEARRAQAIVSHMGGATVPPPVEAENVEEAQDEAEGVVQPDVLDAKLTAFRAAFQRGPEGLWVNAEGGCCWIFKPDGSGVFRESEDADAEQIALEWRSPADWTLEVRLAWPNGVARPARAPVTRVGDGWLRLRYALIIAGARPDVVLCNAGLIEKFCEAPGGLPEHELGLLWREGPLARVGNVVAPKQANAS